MRDQQDKINYQPDDQTRRRLRVKLPGSTLELVQVPPGPHAFHRHSPRHLLMFTGPGARRDGESRVYSRAVSTLRDTSGTFTLVPTECSHDGWAVSTVAAEYLSIAIDPATPVLDPAHGLAEKARRSTGVPRHRWLQHRRIDLAQDLLRRTAMPLADIAFACGFAGQSHFRRVFTAVVGRSPGAWRREYRSGSAIPDNCACHGREYSTVPL